MIIAISLLCGVAILTSCQAIEPRPQAVLIIAVESLSATDVSCSADSPERSGFHILCREAIRFTHAFTPSTLSGPAMASLFTGQYPFEHGLRTNRDALKSEIETIPELIQKQNVATAFFSGGAPILRLNNLHQGFDYVEDNIPPGKLFPYHSLEKTIELYKNWSEDRKRSFAVVYAPDLIYEEETTQNRMGEMRNRSVESRLEEVNDVLEGFFSELKEDNRWDSTTIVLIGLNGRAREIERGEINPINIHSDNTQIAMLVKPALLKKREQKTEEPATWTIDEHVTLADMGITLADIFSVPYSQNSNIKLLQKISLTPFLQKVSTNHQTSRWIAIESGWPLQYGDHGVRMAIRNENFLIKNSSPLAIYNTLLDRFETSPLPIREHLGLAETFVKLSAQTKTPLEYEPNSVLASKFLYYLNIRPWDKLLKFDRELQEAILARYLTENNFIELKKISQNREFKAYTPYFQYLFDKKNDLAKIEPCLNKKRNTKNFKCDDSLFLEYLDYAQSKSTEERFRLLKRFQKNYFSFEQERQSYILNWRKGGIWATSTRMQQPLRLIDWELSRVENQKLKIANQ